MRETLIAGNWKLNGSRGSVEALVTDISNGLTGCNCAVAVCAPYIYIPQVSVALENDKIQCGAQDVSEHEAGAYTGEVSASMLADFGSELALVGHSERRSYHQESSQTVARKFKALTDFSIKPVLCVGETLVERDEGVTQAVVNEQIGAVIEHAGIELFENAIIAYEPVWAIGTGRTATPDQAQAVHADIRKLIASHCVQIADKIQILYGGSMNPGNASSLLAMKDIDGGLIGGASLKADDFLAICRAA